MGFRGGAWKGANAIVDQRVFRGLYRERRQFSGFDNKAGIPDAASCYIYLAGSTHLALGSIYSTLLERFQRTVPVRSAFCGEDR